ncbi:EKC/KEOPS complex subunit LAGE3 [Phlebotomus argentipes]|uniref:EKC/KEOPS complex subunit LAGE3 n=1 Tax=Phlebotomus argentipes TaxID=94469 RepID=UPI002893167B|nr:EKC/KEOPS complex subunit LAGE3 [Phlebotomus argentipes]
MSDLEVLIKVPFPTNRHAEIAYDVLRLDAEPKRNHVEKSLIVEGNWLVVNFSGNTAKSLRTGLTSFLDSLILCCETMDAFGPPCEKYSHY